LKIVIAMDSFKGSLTARQACELVAGAFVSVVPDLQVVIKPMADGGEGTAEAMMIARSGCWIKAKVTGPLPQMQVDAGFAFFADTKTALVEMASANGLELLKPEQMNPLQTTTYGTGQLIRAAADHGATRILLAVGGSATVDGGVGAAMALGWKFLDNQGNSIKPGGGQLERIIRIIKPDKLNLPEIKVLCDVDNPLCGEYGAAKIFAPQKGATPEMVTCLETGLTHLAAIVEEQLAKQISKIPGAGAAGGLAAGAAAFMNAKLVGGIETVMKASGLIEEITNAGWIITGEGRFDEQSLRGKVISGIVNSAKGSQAKIGVIAGDVELLQQQWRQFNITDAVSLRKGSMSLDYAIANSRQLLTTTAVEFATRHFK